MENLIENINNIKDILENEQNQNLRKVLYNNIIALCNIFIKNHREIPSFVLKNRGEAYKEYAKLETSEKDKNNFFSYSLRDMDILQNYYKNQHDFISNQKLLNAQVSLLAYAKAIKKLQHIEKTIDEIQEQVTEIKTLLKKEKKQVLNTNPKKRKRGENSDLNLHTNKRRKTGKQEKIHWKKRLLNKSNKKNSFSINM